MARKYKADHKHASHPAEAPSRAEHTVTPMPADAASTEVVSWKAPEFIAHAKDSDWYVGLAVVAFIVTILIYLITRDILSSLVVVVGAALLGVYAAREPRELEYSIGSGGFTIGDKYYGLHEFRYFSPMGGQPLASIDFMPLKRFSPIITLYYPIEHEEKIIAYLTGNLPYEQRKPDLVDRFMRQIRF